jgi:hypothetical protein
MQGPAYFQVSEKQISHTFEKKEGYRLNGLPIDSYQHIIPKRHILGLVGGNEVYEIKGNRVDLESDLQGITRPFTRYNKGHHTPSNVNSVERSNIKSDLKINATPIPRDEYQMWSYASVNAPQSFNIEACMRPEKF